MNFAGYSKLCNVLTESTKIEQLINNHFDSEISKEIMNLLSTYSSSPLARYIIKRLHNQQFSDPEDLVVKKLDQLEFYNYDKNFYNKLFNIKNENINPGQVLISLLLSEKSDLNTIFIENIGTVDVYYLRNISKFSSCNIPILHDCNMLYSYLIKLYKIIKKNPNILKRYFKNDEISYFLDETIDEIENMSDISQKSVLLINKLLKNSQNKNDINLDWNEYKDILNKILGCGPYTGKWHISNINSDNLMFLAPEGLYFILPQEDIHYYMFSGIVDNNIKFMPFVKDK